MPVQVNGERVGKFTAFINGSSTLPKLSNAPSVEGALREDHAWKPSCFPWPVWMVRRSPKLEECNCAMKDSVVRDITTCEVDRKDPDSDVVEITLPVMANTRHIGKGDELVVFWEAKQEREKLAVTRDADPWVMASRQMKSRRVEQGE